MRLPRDVSGLRLSKRLEPLGYVVTRQKGSHMRLTTTQNGEHHVTIPVHDPLRIGTLSSILTDVASPAENWSSSFSEPVHNRTAVPQQRQRVGHNPVNGFGLLEKPVDPIHQQLQILARHRPDLVGNKGGGTKLLG